jgi:hypothetical protein
MDDFDFEDWWSGGSFVESGIPVNIPDISVSNFDLGSFDLADAFNFGDLSGITGGIEGFGDIADIIGQGTAGIQGIEGFGDIADIVGQGAAGIKGIEGFGDVADIVGQGAAGIQGIEGFKDIADIVGQGAAGVQGIEGFGNVADVVGQGSNLGIDPYEVDQQTSRSEYTFGQGLQDPYEVDQQTTRNEFTFGQGLQDPYEVDQQTTRNEFTFGQGLQDPYEVDGLQGSRTEQTALTGTTPGGKEVIKTDDKKTEDKKTTTDDKKTDDKKTLIDRIFGTTGKDSALLMALLGGLLGLLGKGSAPKLPVGYQGGIPKYTATRVPGRGVQYTRAAGGGLMDLAAGGRPARYLRGGTDGMADKIKTSIDGKQPARLSHGEFVIPADVVSHLGNGNSDAGADVLYEMMDKVRKARTGTTKQGKQINPRNMIPA